MSPSRGQLARNAHKKRGREKGKEIKRVVRGREKNKTKQCRPKQKTEIEIEANSNTSDSRGATRQRPKPPHPAPKCVACLAAIESGHERRSRRNEKALQSLHHNRSSKRKRRRHKNAKWKYANEIGHKWIKTSHRHNKRGSPRRERQG